MINKIVVWNCRGKGNKKFVSNVRIVLDNHYPKVLCLLETKISCYQAKPIFKALGFTKWCLVNRDGLLGGI